MPIYRFDLGTTANGPCGFTAVVEAVDAADAAKKVQDAMPASIDIPITWAPPEGTGIRLIRVYLYAEAVQPQDAMDVEDGDEGEPDDE